MTSDQPKNAQGVGAREAGRQLGVSHSYLLRLAKDKRLPRSAGGLFDVEECRRVLASISDPSQIRGDDPMRWFRGGHTVNEAVTSERPPETSAHAEAETATGSRSRLWKVGTDAAEHATDPFEKGMIAAVVMLAHQVGAAMAVLAVDEGAPLPAAFGLKDAATLGFMELGEDLLRQLPCFADLPATADLPIRYELAAFSAVDWNVVARQRGETADVAAWTAAANERRAQAPA